ncbi:hypothetical protein BJ684DRAFT_10301 [Piptocephalis cylindrospora]|uniref:Cation-transporting P-type ATPase N-terminal domain-containing protein n=1 Tax=Piptocephalis cylindrospora TaxID=1907219 RepID=A0A4P9Y2Y3_9FUNG|nr:hypothetical protein BJ684DRAFT_10301 [Piptocephalis cylindrospora]|eukprot:RKP13278.1 hypothetical protein BJ684DRAFT_10301 [Piptocephalis cylindrospora]
MTAPFPEKTTLDATPVPVAEKPKKGGKDQLIDIDDHLLSFAELETRYSTSFSPTDPGHSQGLGSGKAQELLVENGPNTLTPPKRTSAIVKYLIYLCSLFNLLLILAGCLVYLLYGLKPRENKANVYLGGILIGVAFLNAFIEFYQSQKTAAILDSFLSMIPSKAHVLRDGKLALVPAADLVLGDVVFTRMGDKIPADLRIISASDMKVDNSSLTGESDPQPRSSSVDTQKNPLEAHNLAFNGTLIIAGEGYGLVIRTGDNTVLGQIAGMTAGEKKKSSPLSSEINRFVKIIATIALFTAILFFILGIIISGGDAGSTLTFAIGIFVAWVPEGLPATVTMLLTVAAKRMAGRNVLVKDLQGVETLGAITLLATDKTGTLTRNQMTVTTIWAAMTQYSALRNMGEEGAPIQVDSPGVHEVMQISALCSRAKFDRTDVPVPERQILGDATESGLVRFAAANLPDYDTLTTRYPKVFEVPFNSDTKTHLSIHRMNHPGGSLVLLLKGAPERVLQRCSTILPPGGSNATPLPLTEDHTREFYSMYENMASKGHRVLAFAQLLLPESEYPADYAFDKDSGKYPKDDLTFVGLVSLEDPPKHGVREAIGKCRTAGVQVMMVTGDHPLTAEAIGRKINLILSETKGQVAKRRGVPVEAVEEHEYNAVVIHGETIDGMTEEDWDIIFTKPEVIFARTSPKHKLEIVRRAQSMGHIVGVTGDGVNDSPALKTADLGIAMNLSGSDVSKEAASMILLDDNFASTVRGIEEGRLIFTNLKKSIQYTISHSIPEVIPNLLYILVPIPLPLSAILILVIDLGFELFAALTYAWEVPESPEGLMRLPPRKPVTVESVMALRERKARGPARRVDPESGSERQASRWNRITFAVRERFRARWWKELWRGAGTGEELVDLPLLSWAYLEIGVIELIGALLTFFIVLAHHGITPEIAKKMQGDESSQYFRDDSPMYNLPDGRTLDAAAQVDILAQGQTAYYLGLMIMQVFNLFACKARLRLPFGRYMFQNTKTFIGAGCGAALAVVIGYAPPFNVAFGTSYHLNPIFLLIPFGFGCVIILYAALRMVIRRWATPISWNPEVTGLQMHPTMRSTGSSKKL